MGNIKVVPPSTSHSLQKEEGKLSRITSQTSTF
nr:MAG TPA: hypothetical protein [Herelleviridae sp.]